MFDLSGKTALVTGGSRGLGRAMVLAFAEHGADVIIASRKLESCEELADEVRRTYDRKATPIASNVSHWEECDALVEAAYAAHGRVDVLVNNAGLSPLYDSLPGVTEALLDKVIGVNLKGPFRLAALIGERMVADGGGSIINVSSTAAVRPKANVVPYAMAKAGLEAMTEAMADAFAPSVHVNTIRPGPFLTDISKAWDMEAFAERAKTTIMLRRGGEAEEIVGAALYLASGASSYTTGAVIAIDGGSRR
ncbi:MAG: glucose 1-dehydrogenase [Streptosporangiales bacterium]|nr:glucose 1-dehydrogenase [Streptosporangiales bacterium]